MKAAVFLEPGKVETQDVPKPQLQKPTDAIIKIVRASVWIRLMVVPRHLTSRR